MRSKIKGPKHGSDTNNNQIQINTKAIANGIKSTGKKIDNSLNSIKISAENPGEQLSGKTPKFNKGYAFFGIGIAFLLAASIFSVSFAVNSKMNTAVDTAFEALDSNLIYNGIFIEEVNISGLTKEQAIRRASKDYAGRRLARSFTIAFGDYSKDVTYEDLGGRYNIEATVNEAYKMGRSGSKASRIAFADNLENKREYLVSSLSIDKSKMKSKLREIADEIKNSGISNSEADVYAIMDHLEKSMLIGEEDIIYNIPVKS
ncbi:MAG: peptidoglycan binding domain-containing protein [Clostridia bacterium]|nr:peptidoglycan binding domain-containing protein [Clostridia bacterium]